MMKQVLVLLLSVLLLPSCQYRHPDMSGWDMPQRTKDSLNYLLERHYTLNANFEVRADSLPLEQFPVKDVFRNVYKGDQVVVAEFMDCPGDSVDAVWVKVAHNQEVQGWVRERDFLDSCVPADPLSGFIHLLGSSQVRWLVVAVMLCVACVFSFVYRKRQAFPSRFAEADNVFPALLCFLSAFTAMLYGTMQGFFPAVWEHYYFNPSLNPFALPPLLGVFVGSLWLMLVVLLALADDLFRQMQAGNALLYLFGLLAVCIACYLLVIYTTPYYVGYLFFLWLTIALIGRIRCGFRMYRYKCGNCGAKLREKGECPHCGAFNR